MKTQKNRNIKISIFLFSVTIWLILYPGYYSDDSLNTIQDLKVNNFNGIQGFVWSSHAFLTSLGGTVPELSTLVGLLLLSYSILLFCNTFLPNKSNLTAIVVILIPSVWSFGLTLWHDVTFCAGILFALSLIKQTNLFETKMNKYQLVQLLASQYLVLTRLNGLAISITLIIILIWKLRKRRQELLVVPILFFVCLIPISINWLNSEKQGDVIASGQYFMRSDISCVASEKPKLLEEILTPQEIIQWKSSAACTWFNTSKVEMSSNKPKFSKTQKIWLALTVNHPIQVWEIHWQRNGYLINPVKALLKPAPFIHSSNDWSSEQGLLGSRIYTVFNALSKFSNYTRSVGANHLVLYASIFLGFVFGLRSLKYCLVALALVTLMMFVIAPHADTRFVYSTLLIGYIVIVYYFLELFKRFHPFDLRSKTRL